MRPRSYISISLILIALLFIGAFSYYSNAAVSINAANIECGFGSSISGGRCRGYITSGTSWTVPKDWSTTNTIEVIGGGGAGGSPSSASTISVGGGGGGAYSKIANTALLTGGQAITVHVGAGGATSTASNGGSGGDTYLCDSTANCASISDSAVLVGAKGGAGGAGGNSSTGGSGGAAASGVGTTKYSGGTGGDGDAGRGGGGGGAGAAGPNGNGSDGGAGSSGSGAGGGNGGGSSTAGGNAVSTTGGDGGTSENGTAGGAHALIGVAGTGSQGSGGGGCAYNEDCQGGAGGNGIEWDASHGSGGGGGSTANINQGGATHAVGGNGGLYGGGGGGGSAYQTGFTGGSGAPGIIVITYTPTTSGTVVLNTSFAMPDAQNGLVGWWTFDGNTMVSNAADSSGKGESGFLSNFTSTTTTEGVLGQALAFDGVNDVVRVTSHASLDNLSAFTFTAWVKPTGTTGNNGYIVDKNSGLTDYELLYLDLASTHYIEGSVNTTGTHAASFTNSSASNFTINQWMFLAMTYDDNGDRKIRLYKNGKEITYSAQNAATGSKRDDSAANLQIGGRDNGTFPFKGDIDDVHVYNRVLSAGEIQALYNQSTGTHQNVSTTPPNLSSGLIGWWTFDGPNMISNVADLSGQGNNGTLVGFTSTTTTRGVLGQAVVFDGSSNYIKMGSDAVDLTGQNYVTITAWVKPTKSLSSLANVVRWDSGSSNPYSFAVKTTGSFGSNCSFSNAAGGTNIDNASGTFLVNKWYFVACTYDGTSGNGIMYVNGSPQTNVVSSHAGTMSKTAFGDQTLVIGSGGSIGGYFPGAVDDVRIYNRVLSATEIKQLYSLGH